MPNDVDGIEVDTDGEGYLRDLGDWSEAVAEALAAKDGLALTDNHWEVITFLREYYHEYKIAPGLRVLTKAIGKRFGPDKGNTQYLYELFPYAPASQACKYAGLPKPTGCTLCVTPGLDETAGDRD